MFVSLEFNAANCTVLCVASIVWSTAADAGFALLASVEADKTVVSCAIAAKVVKGVKEWERPDVDKCEGSAATWFSAVEFGTPTGSCWLVAVSVPFTEVIAVGNAAKGTASLLPGDNEDEGANDVGYAAKDTGSTGEWVTSVPLSAPTVTFSAGCTTVLLIIIVFVSDGFNAPYNANPPTPAKRAVCKPDPIERKTNFLFNKI